MPFDASRSKQCRGYGIGFFGSYRAHVHQAAGIYENGAILQIRRRERRRLPNVLGLQLRIIQDQVTPVRIQRNGLERLAFPMGL